MNTKAKLEQAKRDKYIAIESADTEIARLEGRLKDESKPELRNGDYGRYKDSGHNWWYWKKQGRLELFGSQGGNGDKAIMYSNMIKEGNHVDERKRNSEDIGDFAVASKCCFQHEFEGSAGVENIQIRCPGYWFTPDNCIEIGQKLIQLAHEVKRSQDD